MNILSIILVTAIYISAQMLSDIGSLQIVQFFGYSIDAGTFIYPITFSLRDVGHKVLGAKGVRILIISAAVLNLIMAVYFWIVAKIPPDEMAGSSDLWGRVLTPVWRITIASIIAEVVSELMDTEVYIFWVKKITQKYQFLRVLVSNSFSIPIDSLIFTFLAFLGTMPINAVWSIFWGNIILKGVVTLVSLPIIYTVKENPEQV